MRQIFSSKFSSISTDTCFAATVFQAPNKMPITINCVRVAINIISNSNFSFFYVKKRKTIGFCEVLANVCSSLRELAVNEINCTRCTHSTAFMQHTKLPRWFPHGQYCMQLDRTILYTNSACPFVIPWTDIGLRSYVNIAQHHHRRHHCTSYSYLCLMQIARIGRFPLRAAEHWIIWFTNTRNLQFAFKFFDARHTKSAKDFIEHEHTHTTSLPLIAALKSHHSRSFLFIFKIDDFKLKTRDFCIHERICSRYYRAGKRDHNQFTVVSRMKCKQN